MNNSNKIQIRTDLALEIQEDILMNEPETVAKNMSHELKKLIKIKDETVLVVGLGNRNVTPDALGPVVIDRINVTRKIYNASGICAIVPGVMAQSGMESTEMIKGIVKEINAKYVIAIDSLAARNVKRLCTTIQLTDTGINPGSGVGNNRIGLNEDTVGVPVIAIGVPMVVDAATIVSDTMDALINTLATQLNISGLDGTLNSFSDNERYQLVKELLEPQIGTLYVTPKDIDDNVKELGKIIAKAINKLKI